MADDKGEIPEAQTAPSSVLPPHRVPPLIEGHAETPVAETAAEPAAEALADPAANAEPPPPPPIEEPPVSVVKDSPPPRRAAWPLVAAVLLGALAGGVTSFALRYLDDDRGGAAVETRLNALDGRVDALAKKPGADPALAGRLDALERKSDTSAPRDALAALDKRIAAVETTARQASAEAQKAAAVPPPPPAAPAPDLRPLDARIQTVEGRLAKLEAIVNAPKTEVRAPVDRDTDPVAQIGAASARAVAAQSLARDLERGRPVVDDLAALAALGADKTKLSGVRTAVEKGVASTRQLADQFATLAPTLLTDPPVKSESGGFLERLERGAAGLVRVRRVDAGAGDDLQGQVAHVETALSQGDVAGALAAWSALPAGAKAASEAWAARAKTHVEALDTVHALETDAVGAIGKVKS